MFSYAWHPPHSLLVNRNFSNMLNYISYKSFYIYDISLLISDRHIKKKRGIPPFDLPYYLTLRIQQKFHSLSIKQYFTHLKPLIIN